MMADDAIHQLGPDSDAGTGCPSFLFAVVTVLVRGLLVLLVDKQCRWTVVVVVVVRPSRWVSNQELSAVLSMDYLLL